MIADNQINPVTLGSLQSFVIPMKVINIHMPIKNAYLVWSLITVGKFLIAEL